MKETTISYKEKMNNRKEESNLDCASKNVQQQRDQKCTCILGMGIIYLVYASFWMTL